MKNLLGRHHRKLAALLLLMFCCIFACAGFRMYYYSWPLARGDYGLASESVLLKNVAGEEDDVAKGFEKRTFYGRCLDKSVELATGYVDFVSGDRVPAKFNLALTQYEDTKYTDAKTRLEKAYAACCDKNGKVHPEYKNLASDIMLLVGNSIWNDGKPEEAVPAYELALKLNPDNLVAAYNLEKLQNTQKTGGKGGGGAPGKRI